MNMTRRQKRKIRKAFQNIEEWIKIIGLIVFAMAAGAGCYHAYLVQRNPIREKMECVDYEEMSSEEAELTTEVMAEVIEDESEETQIDEIELFALCVEAEAGNQDFTGKRMVASVILNRVDDDDWPDTIEEVITQPYQFTTYWNGAMERASPSEETYRAVEIELEERGWPGLYYFSSDEYSKYGTPWKKVGDHYFSTK